MSKTYIQNLFTRENQPVKGDSSITAGRILKQIQSKLCRGYIDRQSVPANRYITEGGF